MYDSTPTSRPTTSPASDTFTVTRQGFGQYTLKISGSFKPGWLARLSTGLSEHQLNIRSGSGERSRGLHWDAEFELVTSTSTADPTTIDYQALLVRDLPTNDIDDLELSDCRLTSDPEMTNGVWVEVQGSDKLGFLQNLLKSFALYSLFPVKLEVVTDGTLARDRFLLTGIAGMAPSASALKGIEETFRKYLRPS